MWSMGTVRIEETFEENGKAIEEVCKTLLKIRTKVEMKYGTEEMTTTDSRGARHIKS